MTVPGGALQKRIILAVIFGMSVVLLSFGVITYYFVYQNTNHLLENRIMLARQVKHGIDDIIRDNINRLYDISLSGSVDFSDGDLNAETNALRKAYRYSIFTNGVFLLDRQGNTLLKYPEKVRDLSLNVRSIEPISRTLALQKPVVSNIYNLESAEKKVLFILVPLKDNNNSYVGVAGGEIDLDNPLLAHNLGLSSLGRNMYIDVMDSNGSVIASSEPARALINCEHNNFVHKAIVGKKEQVTTCHECHAKGNDTEKTRNMLAFVPLEMAPWGVAIVQPEEEVFAPVSKLKRMFVFFFFGSVGVSLLIALGMSRSIVRPVHELIDATQNIAAGDMSKSLAFGGVDELGMLCSSFEVMRLKLADYTEALQKHNVKLEERVKERTREIARKQKRVGILLKKAISAQEDERKRISRELHDDTLQALSAVLLRMDLCKMYPRSISVEKIEEIRSIVLITLDNILTIIKNLRPSILDDLGLIPAIEWLLDTYLGQKGIQYFFSKRGDVNRKLRSEIEISLFRIVQESISNIARHAEAQNVFIFFWMKEKEVFIDIEDDGKGFDVQYFCENEERLSEDGTGLGLLGIKERVALIDGRVEIFSFPEKGTRISLRVPTNVTGG